MKKRSVSLMAITMLILMVLMLLVNARYNATSICVPSLTVNGSTAQCSLSVVAIDSDAEIMATIKLQKKGIFGFYNTIKTWDDVTGKGRLSFADTYSPVSSGDYRMTADIEVYGDSGNDCFTSTVTAANP